MRSYGPRPLTIWMSLLALCVLLGYFSLRALQPATAQPTDCPTLLREADYPSIIEEPPGQQDAPHVQLNTDLIPGQTLAFVQARDRANPRHPLAVYLYNCTMQRASQNSAPTLTPLFQQHDLIRGSVSITHTHTLSISELDTTLSGDASLLMSPWQQMIYREYRWQQGTFEQTLFPSLYPVLSRAEAELLQDQANTGATLPWSDPIAAVTTMAQNLLHWPSETTHATIQDQSTTTAHVTLTRDEPPLELDITLQRLIQPDQHGLWFITSASSPGLSLNHTTLNAPVASPMTVDGKLNMPGGLLTPSARLFDHTLARLAILNADALTLLPDGSFHGTLHYTNDLPGQPSLLLISFAPPGQDDTPSALLLTNVLLS